MEDNPAASAMGFVGAVIGAYFGWAWGGVGGVIAGVIIGFMIGFAACPVFLALGEISFGLGFIAIVVFAIWHFWGTAKPDKPPVIHTSMICLDGKATCWKVDET